MRRYRRPQRRLINEGRTITSNRNFKANFIDTGTAISASRTAFNLVSEVLVDYDDILIETLIMTDAHISRGFEIKFMFDLDVEPDGRLHRQFGKDFVEEITLAGYRFIGYSEHREGYHVYSIGFDI